jgi:hypothetical protein
MSWQKTTKPKTIDTYRSAVHVRLALKPRAWLSFAAVPARLKA